MRASGWIVATLAWGLVPAAAHAYLIDLNDARVADYGSLEVELQPIGYWQTLLGDEEYVLIAPSMQLYLGFADGWDLIFLTRGFALLNDVPDQSRYSLAEQTVLFRTVLRDGAYSDEEAEGPSLVLQSGLLLPGVEDEPGFGASIALLFAQAGELGTLHLNAWINRTRQRTFNLFLSAAIEGPPDWSVRPTVEVYYDYDEDEGSTLSGLLGAVADLSDDFSLEAGVRVGGFEDWLELEVRVAAWWAWELFDSNPAEDVDEASET